MTVERFLDSYTRIFAAINHHVPLGVTLIGLAGAALVIALLRFLLALTRD